LQTVQKSKEARRGELLLERERKAALMEHLFRRGTRGEATKQTEIGETPKSWHVSSLNRVAKISSGGTPDRSKPEYWGGTIPWVKTGEIRYNTIVNTEERITNEGLENSAARILPAGTLLMAMYGQGVTRGRVAVLGIDAALNQACAAITPTNANLSTRFAFQYLQFAYETIRMLGHGANQKNLNSHLVGSIPVPLPPMTEQEEISNALTAMDAKLRSMENEAKLLSELFNAMLEQLMTGRLSAAHLANGEQRQ
jgi:type I restriction enzyme S subunit